MLRCKNEMEVGSTIMKKIAVLMILALTISIFCGTGYAGTYKLGSHSVSLNLSVPANYIVEPPIYRPDLDNWIYGLPP